MRLSAVGFLMILTTMLLSGCGQQQVASVEDKGSSYYGRHQKVVALPLTMTPEPSAIQTRDLQATVAKPLESKPLAQNSVRYVPLGNARWEWPVNGKVIDHFGQKQDGVVNEGITLAAAEGTPVKAAQAGEVAFVGTNIRNYGNMVILRHGDGTLTSYSHARSVAVAKGEKVDAGKIIAFVGHSGSAKTPQLHFAVRQHDKAIDPMSKLPRNVASN